MTVDSIGREAKAVILCWRGASRMRELVNFAPPHIEDMGITSHDMFLAAQKFPHTPTSPMVACFVNTTNK
jgi:hypothetical protein